MNKLLILSALLVFVAFPVAAYAGVVINEVAWMGTTNSAQDEWIELAGPAGTNLDGWRIFTEDGGMTITLLGTMGNGGYFLIERTDDTTIPDVSADLITTFGSGLGNTGDILILQDDQGSEVDRVDGSNDWVIGGNNMTKETLQRTLSGWITATATPRAENQTTGIVEQEPNNNENNTTTNSNESEASSDFPQSAYYSTPTPQKLRAYAGKDQTALVGASILFGGRAEVLAGSQLDGARFLWNFGDGSIGEGKKVLHAYYYPGSYRVFLDASTGVYSATAALNIVVIPNLLGVSEIKPGAWFELINDTARTVDVSGFGVRMNSEKPFYFPQNTFLDAQSRLVLNQERIGFLIPDGGTFQILYPNGSVFLST